MQSYTQDKALSSTERKLTLISGSATILSLCLNRWNILSKSKVVTSSRHWHSLPVQTLSFTEEGKKMRNLLL